MSILDRVASAMNPLNGRHPTVQWSSWYEDPIALYGVLRAYYAQVHLYEDLNRFRFERNEWSPAMKPLRNPAHRVVEFHVSHIWPELPEIEAENEAIVEPIEQVWTWSNWAAMSKVAVRWLARDGDLIIKVTSEPPEGNHAGKVGFQLIDVEQVAELDTDHRGVVQYLRIDVPMTRREGDKRIPYTHIEVWDTERQRIWERDDKGEDLSNRETERLGAPDEEYPLSAFGIDFIPFVHAKFLDVGHERGMGSFAHAIDKIDEANVIATRLHQMMYRHNSVTWAVQSEAVDKSNRPVAPLMVTSTANGLVTTMDSGDLTLAGERMVKMPPGYELASMVPNINYEAARNIIADMMAELEQDLPELAYHRVRDQGELSGRAIQLMLGDAAAKSLEARANFEAAIVRADQMALTIAKFLALKGFEDVGDYDSGATEHAFEERPIFDADMREHWDIEKLKGEAAMTAQQSGVSTTQTLRERGYSEEEIAEMQTERDAEEEERIANAQRAFDAGSGGSPFGQQDEEEDEDDA